MSKIYTVESFFDGPDASWVVLIGNFTDKSVAIDIKDKWDKFYKSKMSIFDEPKEYVGHTEDGYVYPWDSSDEYYDLVQKYGDIRFFLSVDIRESLLNEEVIDADIFIGSEIGSLMKEWNRDYKIDSIIKP